MHQLGDNSRQLGIVSAVTVALVDDEILALLVAEVAEAHQKRREQHFATRPARARLEATDPVDLRLLPRGDEAAAREQTQASQGQTTSQELAAALGHHWM